MSTTAAAHANASQAGIAGGPHICSGDVIAERRRLTATLRELGVEQGADVFVVTDLAACGLPQCFGSATTELLDFYADALLEATRGGTLSFITYSFDFARTRVYDSRTTPTRHGVLNEFLRQHPDTVRSLHPFASCAAIGARAGQYMSGCGPSCFGAGSPFARLVESDATCVVIGKRPGHVPLYHTAEQYVGVPYCYNKRLTGEVVHEGERVDREFTAFLRYRHLDVAYDFQGIYDGMEANVAHRATRYLRSTAAVFSLRDYYDWIVAQYERDVHAFLLRAPDYTGDGPPA